MANLKLQYNCLDRLVGSEDKKIFKYFNWNTFLEMKQKREIFRRDEFPKQN